MIVKQLEQIVGTPAQVDAPGWVSRRLILASDGMGYSVHDTLIKAGAVLEMEYRHHLETVYCIEGEGDISDLATGITHAIRPGTLYALNRHDRHILRANRGLPMRMVCVFNPPLTGQEVHDGTGAYPASADANPTK
jgi:L-ectoine synthase